MTAPMTDYTLGFLPPIGGTARSRTYIPHIILIASPAGSTYHILLLPAPSTFFCFVFFTFPCRCRCALGVGAPQPDRDRDQRGHPVLSRGGLPPAGTTFLSEISFRNFQSLLCDVQYLEYSRYACCCRLSAVLHFLP